MTATARKKKPASRFVETKVGCVPAVKAIATGLTWESDGSAKRMTHSEAEKYVKDLGKGWRLPTVEELFCLVDRTRTAPAIDTVFKCESSWYWTSTPVAGASVYAWVVYFYHGGSHWDARSGSYFVRAVRASQ